MTITDTTVSNLIINTLTSAQFDTITPSDTELYFVTDEVISSSDVITALGYTPYNGTTNPNGYITSISSGDVTTALGFTPYNGTTNPNGYITSISSGDVTTALGYTPYNGTTNPNGYQANIIETVKVNGTALTPSSKAVNIVVPTSTTQLTNDSGFITGVTSSMVTTALGFTPVSISVQTNQSIVDNGASGALSLSDNTSLYKVSPSGATTISFGGSTSASSNIAYTFELCLVMSTVYAITWPNSITWQDGETPDLSSAGTYFLAFRTLDGGSTWLGNLQGKW